MRKNRVLLLNPHYYPGYRSGGPQQTFMNIVEAFGDECEFYVLTLNHDLGETKAYENIKPGWNQVGKAKVRYVPDDGMTVGLLAKLSEKMDVVYAGGLFERTTRLALKANRRNMIACPLWIAPMGVFSEGAFSQKRWKKLAFIYYEKLFGAFRKIRWSFTSELEKKDFEKYLGKPKQNAIASDIPRRIGQAQKTDFSPAGELKIIFLSRICHQKNLGYAIDLVGNLKGDIVFDIYGTLEDQAYWQECKKRMANLPRNVKCRYQGEAESSRVVEIFSRYDVFLFPTLGENFGHVIYEALVAGCVPVISDTTPWRDLEEQECGKVIPLEDRKRFQEAMEAFVFMDERQKATYSENTMDYADTFYRETVTNTGYREIFGLEKMGTG